MTSILAEMDDWYGEIAPLTVTRGKVHEYLGMTIDYSEEGKVEFTMYDYIDDLLEKNYHRICEGLHPVHLLHTYLKPTPKTQNY